MGLSAADWNVNIIGKWNRAILTPSWIATNLFGLAEGSPIEVLVPLDEYAPYQVKHGGVLVVAQQSRLHVQPVASTFEGLEKAKEVGAKAIGLLPRTPLTAAGINCQYKTTDVKGKLQELITHQSDRSFDEGGFKITGRAIRRTLSWENGQVNISIEHDDEKGYSIQFNFHLSDKNDSRLKAWIEQPIEKIQAATNLILENYIGINLKDDFNGKE